jgi:hypothetical protein
VSILQSESVHLADWAALADRLEEMERNQDRADFERSRADWHAGCRMFHDTDLQWIGTHDYEDETHLPFHARCLRVLLGMGEELIAWSKEINASLKVQKNIAAGVEILRVVEDSCHHDTPPEELERIRKIIFGAEA